jgi:hypothetical protein
MSFDREDLAAIDAAEEVRIETQAPAGPVHRTVIWAVVDGDETYVRSYRGATARWYQEATANPAVALHVGAKRLAATAIPATDPDAVQRTSAAFLKKYAGDPAAKAMVRQEILSTTLRLEPT